MVGRTLRALLVGTLTLGATALPVAAGTASAAAVEQQFAVVRLTIEQADGKVLRATQTVPWGQAATFEVGESQRHVVAVVPGNGELAVDYDRDGAEVLADATVPTRRGSAVVHSDAASTVAVRVLRTTARLESAPL